MVLDNLDDVIALISTNGKYRFVQRQILYKMRPIVRNEIDKMLKTGTFNGIITDYEYENGEIPGMYRDSRGSIYHPHRKETITLGTLMVENYKRPEWTSPSFVHEKELQRGAQGRQFAVTRLHADLVEGIFKPCSP